MKNSSTTLFVAEPPAVYLVKPPAVVDASVLCALLFNEAQADEAAKHLSAYTLHAPQLLSYEVATVALKKTQAKLSVELAIEILNAFSQLAIELHPINVEQQFTIARQYKLTSYDAAYLAVAAYLKAPLLTFDKQLATAAQTHLKSL